MVSAAIDRRWSIALLHWRTSRGHRGARSSPGTPTGIGFELDPTVLSTRWMMDLRQSVSSRSATERTCIGVLANDAVKLPAPLILLVGGHSFGYHLPMSPTQRQSAPQLTAGVSRPCTLLE